MTLWRLTGREILHRRGSFALSVLSVALAVAALVATVGLLAAHDARTEQLVQARIAATSEKVRQRQAEAEQRAAELNEAFRKIMLKFGYNLLILPKEEDVVRYTVQGAPSSYMDESAVRTLAESGIMTVRHLLPVLQQGQVLLFGDKRREVFLVGTRGEVPLSHLGPQEPLLSAVRPGGAVIGHEVHAALGAGVGDTVQIVDRRFQVLRVLEPSGTRDDSSAWIDLAEAQQLLGQPGRINAILALSCLCSHAELGKIQEEIVRILPGTQVRTMVNEAVIRYESRVRAAEEASAQVQLARRQGSADVEAERRGRAELRAQMEAFAGWLVPLALLGSALWLGLLAWGNVRQRRTEIGILRAIGLGSRQVFAVFLGRSLLVGPAGACVGFALGFGVAWAWPEGAGSAQVFDPLLLAGVVVLAPVVSALACLAPALLAAREDPAAALREE